MSGSAYHMGQQHQRQQLQQPQRHLQQQPSALLPPPIPNNHAPPPTPPPPPPYAAQYPNGTLASMHPSQRPPIPAHFPTNIHPPHPTSNYPAYMNGPAVPATGVPNGPMRFPIPPSQPMLDARNMSGARHKKEIKRRTKTGCLTCRKRRIKCDEAQPACRNCTKSKRECLGYDPIFKEQQAPPVIKPAPSHHHDFAPGQANHDQRSYPNRGSSRGWVTVDLRAASSLPSSGHAQYEANVAIDPVLAAIEHGRQGPANHVPPVLQSCRRVVPLNMDNLVTINNIQPNFQTRDPPPPLSPSTQEDVENFYQHHYAGGLDQFFETSWYSTQGFQQLQRDLKLRDFVAQCVEQFKARNDNAANQAITSLEARMVWQLSCMPRASSGTRPGDLPQDPIAQTLLPRLDTIEHLLTGQFLPVDRIPPPVAISGPPPDSDMDAARKRDEMTFWHEVGRFVSIRDDSPDPHARAEIQKCFDTLRGILEMRESRDLIYSIAIVRHIGGRMPDFHPQRQLVTSTRDPNNEITKLTIAHRFVDDEDHRGSTQIIQRICSMALWGWILQKRR